MRNRIFLIASALTALTLTTGAKMFADDASGHAHLLKVSVASQGQAAAGLKEALAHATVEAVHLTGRPDGYFKDAAIKILLPHQLKPLETGLRAVGYGPKIDQFVLSMNRAAEAAAPKAEPIFERAIENMTFSDAQRIVTGGGHSATDYFKAKTSDDLRVAFAPIVKKTMAEYSVTKQYDDLVAHYQSGSMGLGGLLGGVGQSFDLNNYVVQKSLDGLFYVVGQEEVKIRTNPAAQVTPLLRQVFGGLRGE
ncbi:MAG TPA: DUF4197 domain-containing protein [Candidatus Binataceae bacterium]|nr:DUF4197 domain-containing protein [Candidatus Binataceae bacterium]